MQFYVRHKAIFFFAKFIYFGDQMPDVEFF